MRRKQRLHRLPLPGPDAGRAGPCAGIASARTGPVARLQPRARILDGTRLVRAGAVRRLPQDARRKC
ncbi:hypothetical protein LP420_06070 [Massilia sp. B-10]|nr:hypothetical protein LP420_06070 [Massilia sp. B-10]